LLSVAPVDQHALAQQERLIEAAARDIVGQGPQRRVVHQREDVGGLVDR
jgi:hypothetical protein